MISNSGDESAISSNRSREMAIFDLLPEALRTAFSEASRNYTVIATGEALILGVHPARALALLQAEDRAVYARHARMIARGEPPS